jgi:hypothetical protein
MFHFSDPSIGNEAIKFFTLNMGRDFMLRVIGKKGLLFGRFDVFMIGRFLLRR